MALWHCILIGLCLLAFSNAAQHADKGGQENGNKGGHEEIKAATAQFLGEEKEADPNSAAVQKAAIFAVDEYNKGSKGKRLFKLSRVVSAKYQVVFGISYSLDVELGKTKCKKGEMTKLESCPLVLQQKQRNCHFEVLNIPGRDLQLHHIKCK